MNSINILGYDVEILNAAEVESARKIFSWLWYPAVLIEPVFAVGGVWAGFRVGASVKTHLLAMLNPGLEAVWSYGMAFLSGAFVCVGIIGLVQGLLHKHVYGHCQRLIPLNDSEVDEALRLSAQHEEVERYRVAVTATRDIFIRTDLEVMRIVSEQVLKDAETQRRQLARRQLAGAV